jgi:tetratricopeptide (TPR) repeat protein
MAGVFLSYDRDDKDRARHFARVLEGAGHTVWWDLHVRGGAQFGKVIEEALKAADAVVVLWSKNSIESAWVKDEASAGRDSGRLVPVTIDGTEPPLGFRQFQTIDLTRWKGRGTPPQLRTLLADIEAPGGTVDGPKPAKLPPSTMIASRSDKRRLFAGVLVVLAIGIAAAAYWLLPDGGSTVPTVAVEAADATPLSRDMARELLIKLGALQGNGATNINLVDHSDGDPDLRIAVNGAQRSGQTYASVALVSGRKNDVLWSKDFEEPASARSEIAESLAFATARVLGCAVEEASGQYGRLPQELRRKYLNVCATLAEMGWDNRALLPQLREITEQAPAFRPAWARLITAQSSYVSLVESTDEEAKARADLQRDIQQARKVDPHMAEATIGELSLDLNMPYARAIDLADRAKAEDPRNSFVLTEHAGQMQRVGRMEEALDDVDQAAKVDLLSPFTRAELIRTLLYAGEIDRARAELEQAKQLWPGVRAIHEAELAIELRAGNFEKAVREEGESGTGFDLFAAAFHDPTDAKVRAFVDYIRGGMDNLGRVGMALQALGQLNRPNEFYEIVGQFRPLHYQALARNSYVLFRPWMAGIRRDRRFMLLANRLGLVRYWRTSGKWPDFCADPQLTYNCKTEAAKLG